MRNIRFALLPVFIFVAACEQAEITQPPILVTPKNQNSAVGIDVYARDRSGGNPVPRFRGQETVQVRTFGNPNGSGYAEMVGSNCILDSGLYESSFVTPANIGVPDYGPDSPSLFVRCQSASLSGSMTVDIFNLTSAQRQSNSYGTGLLGAIIIGAVAAANVDPAQDEYSYPAIGVQMN